MKHEKSLYILMSDASFKRLLTQLAKSNKWWTVAWQVKRYMKIAQFIFHFLLHSSARYLHGNCISCYLCDLWLLVQRFHYHCGNLCPLRYYGLLIWNCVPISFFFFFFFSVHPLFSFRPFSFSLEPKSSTGLNEIGTLQADLQIV